MLKRLLALSLRVRCLVAGRTEHMGPSGTGTVPVCSAGRREDEMRRSITAVLVTVGLLAAGAVGPLAARAGDLEVKKEGPCSGPSEWKLEVRLEDNNTFRVRWEADSGIAGQRWTLTLLQNGAEIASAVRRTNADGEAQLNLRGVQNTAGADTFVGSARNLRTGETCSASASI